MGFLQNIERRLEGGVQGVMSRLFSSEVHPSEISRALRRYAANSRSVGLDGVVVPNAYRVHLSEHDAERLAGVRETLQRELAAVVRRDADERDWVCYGPVRVELVTDEEVRRGAVTVHGRFQAEEEARESDRGGVAPPGPPAADAGSPRGATSEPEPGVPSARVEAAQGDRLALSDAPGRGDPEWGGSDPGRSDSAAPESPPPSDHGGADGSPRGPAEERPDRTLAAPLGAMGFPSTVSSGNRPRLWVRSGAAAGWSFTATDGALIGRGSSCDAVISDPSVSRYHAELHFSDGEWWLHDRESTNGVWVDGVQVSRTRLTDGDTVTLGRVRLGFAAEP